MNCIKHSTVIRIKDGTVVKALPPEETKYPGVSITTRKKERFCITQTRNASGAPLFTLWRIVDGGYKKRKQAADYEALRDEIEGDAK